ncbi:phage portal protein [Vibrio alginolyticus]|uniref:phage portal protein n=1 Tax=Vibrio harveyi group TaxID=717610 RepID=UPI00211CF29A|nr:MULTISPECIES: phage portal protein [Vibrio harveyi group]MCQ9244283.1 phage portal protein [Vibrio diabolicus]MCR9883575.1 phage portal protein [Vibrio alginolyticus]
MGFIRWATNMFGGKSTSVQSGGQVNYPDQYLSSPKSINEDTALQLAVVYRCIDLTAKAIGTMPINVYETKQGIKSQVKNDLWDLIQNKPNPHMTGQEFRETMVLNLMLHGNFYARIARNSLGEPVALWVMPSQHTSPQLTKGTITYLETFEADGSYEERVHKFEDVLHIKGMGNGLTGLSPLAYHKASLGTATAHEQFTADFYRSGGKPGGVLYKDGIINQRERQTLEENVIPKMSAYGDVGNHGILVLEGGYKYQQIQLTPSDLNTLATRKFQSEELARVFGVPLALLNLGENSQARTDKIEDVYRSWVKTDLKSLMTKIINGIQFDIMTREERKKYTVEFETGAMYDFPTLSKSVNESVQNGVLTQNEAREKLNMPRKDDPEADKLRQQMQMVASDGSTSNQSEESNGN